MRSRIESHFCGAITALTSALGAVLLTACAAAPDSASNVPAPVAAASAPVSSPVPAAEVTGSVAPVDSASAPAHSTTAVESMTIAAANLIRRRNPVGTMSADMLAYADRTRAMPPAELVQEISRVSDASTPELQLQLAIALSQTRQMPDLIRAQDNLQRLLLSQSPDAQPLFPLARLLASRLAEQRRVEDSLERQNQQIRDQQRQLNQTNEKLEALRAIERSLSHRQSSSAAPANGASRPTP